MVNVEPSVAVDTLAGFLWRPQPDQVFLLTLSPIQVVARAAAVERSLASLYALELGDTSSVQLTEKSVYHVGWGEGGFRRRSLFFTFRRILKL